MRSSLKINTVRVRIHVHPAVPSRTSPSPRENCPRVPRSPSSRPSRLAFSQGSCGRPSRRWGVPPVQERSAVTSRCGSRRSPRRRGKGPSSPPRGPFRVRRTPFVAARLGTFEPLQLPPQSRVLLPLEVDAVLHDRQPLLELRALLLEDAVRDFVLDGLFEQRGKTREDRVCEVGGGGHGWGPVGGERCCGQGRGRGRG